MKIDLALLAAIVALSAGCVPEAPNEIVSDIPRNDPRIVDRTCLAAVVAHSGKERADLFAANYAATSSGAKTTIFTHPPATSYVPPLPTWECFTNSAGDVTRIDGPAAG